MFQLNVKGRDLKNLLSLHSKQLEEFASLRERAEHEHEERVAKDAAAMRDLPAHLTRLSDAPYCSPVLPMGMPRSAALKAMDEAQSKQMIALNRWFHEQIQDDTIYEIGRDDLFVFGLSQQRFFRPGGVMPPLL